MIVERTYFVSKTITSTLEVDEHMIGEINAMIKMHIAPNYKAPELTMADFRDFIERNANEELEKIYLFTENDFQVERMLFDEITEIMSVLFDYLEKDKNIKDDLHVNFIELTPEFIKECEDYSKVFKSIEKNS